LVNKEIDEISIEIEDESTEDSNVDINSEPGGKTDEGVFWI